VTRDTYLPSQSLQIIMNIITCQHEWVRQCQTGYRCNPPVGFHFENAHYPLSEKQGGTETVRLWYPDHIVQGILQTLELGRPCIDTRKYKKELGILSEVYPHYVDLYGEAYRFCKTYQGQNLNKKVHANKTEDGKSEHAVRAGKKTHEIKSRGGEKDENGKSLHYLNTIAKAHEKKDENGKSLHYLNTIAKAHEKKDEKGRSLLGVANAERLHSQKDENGKSIVARRSGLKNLINKEKDELGRSVNAVKAAMATNREKNEKGKSVNATKAAAIMNSQVWESTVDRFRSTAGNVAQHNIRNGWDPAARVKIS